MTIKIVTDTISFLELQEIAKEFYDPMIKGVVDIERDIAAFGGEYHMDANVLLIESGSLQKDIWGFNVYLDKPRDLWLEYTSLINIRPAAGNRDMEVHDGTVRDRMKKIVDSKIV